MSWQGGFHPEFFDNLMHSSSCFDQKIHAPTDESVMDGELLMGSFDKVSHCASIR